MVIYYIDINDAILELVITSDIANQEAFNREMDELFPFGWSLDRSDLLEEYDDPYGQEYDEDRGDN